MELFDEEESFRKENISRFFKDCLPAGYQINRYSKEIPLDRFKAINFERDDLCNVHKTKMINNTDIFRYQQHLRGFSDILTGKFDPRAEVFAKAHTANAAGHFIKHVVSLAPYWATNLLFDTNISEPYLAKMYRAGIKRTYGNKPFDCAKEISLCSEDVRPKGNADVINSHRFSKLKEIYKESRSTDCDDQGGCQPPYWIINATTGLGPSDFSFEHSVLEMTADRFSSGQLNGTDGDFAKPESIEIPEAVAASAAFFDPQQRSIGGDGAAHWLIGKFLRGLGLEWSDSFPNPNREPNDHKIHKYLPWPIYQLHGFQRGPQALNIHISDGGHSENLGLWALIRRGVREIIVSDHSLDRSGKMEDLCNVRNELMNDARKTKNGDHRMRLIVPALEGFDYLCDRHAAKVKTDMGYAVHYWENPVLEGCIIMETRFQKGNIDCRKVFSEKNSNSIMLYIIKPSLKADEIFGKHVQSCINFIYGKGEDIEECKEFLATKKSEKENLTKFPFETFAFLQNRMASCDDKDNQNYSNKDGMLIFSQNSTVSMTYNSSPFLHVAYRELGSHLAKHLVYVNGAAPGLRSKVQKQVRQKLMFVASGEAAKDERMTDRFDEDDYCVFVSNKLMQANKDKKNYVTKHKNNTSNEAIIRTGSMKKMRRSASSE